MIWTDIMRGAMRNCGVAMSRLTFDRRLPCFRTLFGMVALTILALPTVHGQQASVSAWDAADFRVWAYIPYWATQTQINNFASNGMYSHISDVLYFGGLRPDASGNITYAASSYQTQFNTIRSQAATNGFKL